ncbi:DUF1993 domain-containing protein [Altererythrobacter sp. CAU 1778]
MHTETTLTATYVQMLRALSAWLDKAAATRPGDSGEEVLSARLAPDMFPLSTQVRFACVEAYEGVARLRAEALPPVVAELLEEGRGAGDAPGTLAGAKARIAETLGMLAGLDAAAETTGDDASLAHELPNGMVFDLSREQYARDWALPQFYFHLMAAYAILRAEGVDLGKADYVAHMFAYLRPGTMPG